jgi:hypothetical protein
VKSDSEEANDEGNLIATLLVSDELGTTRSDVSLIQHTELDLFRR